MIHKFNLPDIANNVYYKDNPVFFIELRDLIENHIKGFQQSLISQCSRKEYKDYSYLRNWINSKLEKLSDPIYKWNTKCYWILFGLTDFPRCQYCGKLIGIGQNIKITKGYPKSCSTQCAAKLDSTKKARVITTRERYGVDNINQLDGIKKQKQEYFLHMYGVKSNFQIEAVKEKIKQDNLLKYGVEFYQQTQEYLEKVKNTLFARYGVSNTMQSSEFKNKIIQTNILKYGVEYSFQAESVKKKIIETCLKKYGTYHPMQIHEIMQKTHRHYTFENTTFDSAPELAFFIFLRDHHIDFEYQPSDKKFIYEFNGKQHRYYPDFKVNGQYIEIKGDHFIDTQTGKWIYPYDRSRDALYETKHQFILANNIIILYANGYTKYLDYVKNVYGKDYINQFKTTIKPSK